MVDTPITVFYDGHCGLCHRLVRFLIARDSTGEKFHFAPLQGDHCAKTISPAERQRLPDSVVVQTNDGQLLVKAAAVLHLLARIGGFWRVIGTILAMLPNPLLDFGYDRVARIRRQLFSKPGNSCPLVPPEFQSRFHP